MRVQIDQAGSDDAPAGIDDAGGAEVGVDRGDAAVVVDQPIDDAVAVGTDPTATLDDDRWTTLRSPPLPRSRYSPAMRTATPLRTWSTTTERGRSGTSTAISTPRF